MYPYLPKTYILQIQKLYGKREFGIEDRLLFYYTRLDTVKTRFKKLEKPLIVDLINKSGNYEEYIYQHPNWKEKLKSFKSSTETIEIPYANDPKLIGYLPFGIWIDEYVVYIEVELLKEANKLEEYLFRLLEGKGTFVVISKPKNSKLKLPDTFLYKKVEKNRKIFE